LTPAPFLSTCKHEKTYVRYFSVNVGLFVWAAITRRHRMSTGFRMVRPAGRMCR